MEFTCWAGGPYQEFIFTFVWCGKREWQHGTLMRLLGYYLSHATQFYFVSTCSIVNYMESERRQDMFV